MSSSVDEPSISPSPESAPGKRSDYWFDKASAAAGPLIVITLVAGSWLAGILGIGAAKLEIVTSATRDTSGWRVAGRVIMRADGGPVLNARVWAVAVDSVGNRFSPADSKTDPEGQFELRSIPIFLTADTSRQATDVTVFVSASAPRDSNKLLRGSEVLRLTRFGRVQWIEPSPLALLSIGLTFVLTILIGLVQLGPTAVRMKRAKYYSLVVLSFLFTFTMVGLIAAGLRSVNASSSPGDVMSLGFANIYRGTYVKDQLPEWLFSLTSPQITQGGQATTGFGAPLWLLLIAVLGSAVFTIALLVKHVKDPVVFDDDVAFRGRVEELVRHQFYILFSPLGAVIVYQLLVAAGAASVQATVAMAIFAAGVAVNVLLDKALKAVQEVLK